MQATLVSGCAARVRSVSWVRTVLVGFGLLLLAGACSDDEAESDYYCCVASSLCDLCGCSTSTQGIADAGNELRCKQYLDEADWECIAGSEDDARNNCSGH